jgi:hypothetical protein
VTGREAGEAQQLERNGYVRLSIDEEIWANQGRYGIDYPAEKYEEYKMDAGGQWELIHLKVSPDELRKRLAIRSLRFDANAAFPITEDILNTFLNGFEEPVGEGEIVLEP